MRIAHLADLNARAAALACYRALDAEAPDDYRQLAALLVDYWRAERCRAVGIGGGQGAGKSTLGRLLEASGEHFGLRTLVLGLDDFYLPQAARQRLARAVHPLLATRGPPGTHDAAALDDAVAALGREGTVRLPSFDKGIDDRSGYREETGPFDLIVVEGWCVGAAPAAAEEPRSPINALERDLDPDGRWRQHIEDALSSDYQRLFDRFDSLLFLQVPDLDAVRRWRLAQEGERPRKQRMTAADVARFVEHYERITRRMLRSTPGTADVVVELDQAHRVRAVRFKRARKA